jgi:sphingomyelin phosphodiesterase
MILITQSGNPTFRVYSVDPVTFAILDYSVYYANISSPTYQSGPTWELLYSVKETYGPLVSPPVTDPSAELTPAFWHSLTDLFESDDSVFQAYYARKSRDYSLATCTGSCKTSEICQLRAMQAQYNCGTVTAGVNFRRDAVGHGHEHGNGQVGGCEGSSIVPILSRLSGSGVDRLISALIAHLGAEFLDMVTSRT